MKSAMFVLRFLLRGILLLTFVFRLPAYSVLSHEAMIDAMWDVRIKAILQARFPDSTPAELKKAHGYA